MTSQWLNECERDARLGLRSLRRQPSFALAVTLILALGIGATAAMWSVLHGVVLRPLPYAKPGELVVLSTHRMAQDQFEGTSIPNMTDWHGRGHVLAAVTAYRRTSVSYVILS